MQHVRIAKYRLNADEMDNKQEISDLAQGGMLKIFKDHPGFISYGLADCGEGIVLSISHWDTHDEAEAAHVLAREWVAANLAHRVELLDNITGDYLFLE
jgi:hypothetical protein